MRRRMLVVVFFVLVAIVLPLSAFASAPVHILTVDAAIEPTVAQYIETGIRRAEREGAAAIVIELDTPGGLSSSTTDIVRSMLNARVPVIVYVYPVTAKAASAGTFITLAANVAVMAPGTRIGSAHPVFAGPFGSDNEEDSIMMKKVVNDSASFIVSIAKQRGRNEKWAEQAVRNSVNVTAEKAVELKVVDFIAPDIRTLLEKADGMKVKTAAGEVTLNVKDSPVQEFPMPWYKRFLNILANGTIAYILLLIAIFGIIFEINTPGATLPGVIGGIALILFLYSASVLPVNWAGIVLILLAIGLFIVDIKVPTHGVLTVGGIIAFFLGAMMVFGTGNPAMAAPIAVIAAGTLATALFFVFLVGLGVRALKNPIVTGKEGVIGLVTTAKTNIDPIGKIFVEGSWWTAETEDQPIKKGDKVKIIGIEGLKIRVVKDDSTHEEA